MKTVKVLIAVGVYADGEVAACALDPHSGRSPRQTLADDYEEEGMETVVTIEAEVPLSEVVVIGKVVPK